MEQQEKITLCNLEVILMPNGEVICLGKSIGWFKNLRKHLSIKSPESDFEQARRDV